MIGKKHLNCILKNNKCGLADAQVNVLEQSSLEDMTKFILSHKVGSGGPRGRVVKVADFSALDHSIISPMWVRASHGARIHM